MKLNKNSSHANFYRWFFVVVDKDNMPDSSLNYILTLTLSILCTIVFLPLFMFSGGFAIFKHFYKGYVNAEIIDFFTPRKFIDHLLIGIVSLVTLCSVIVLIYECSNITLFILGFGIKLNFLTGFVATLYFTCLLLAFIFSDYYTKLKNTRTYACAKKFFFKLCGFVRNCWNKLKNYFKPITWE